MFPCFRVVLLEIELMIGLLSAFKVMEPQRNYIKELYDLDEYKFTRMLYCYFSCIAYLFYIYQLCIFCNSHEIHFRTTTNSLLCKCALINKVNKVRLVKETCM
jgi:hypothetical protein